MIDKSVLKNKLILEIQNIYKDLIDAEYYKTNDHRFETALSNAISDYTTQYDQQVIGVLRSDIAQLQSRVALLESR